MAEEASQLTRVWAFAYDPVSRWWASPVAPSELARATELANERDRGHRFTVDPAKLLHHRITGVLGEEAFACWLVDQGIEHTHDGGHNANPDFQIGRLSVEVKARANNGPFLPNYNIGVPWEHAHKKPDAYVFVGYDQSKTRILLFGWLTWLQWAMMARLPTGLDAEVRTHPGLVVQLRLLAPLDGIRAGSVGRAA